VVAIVLVPRSVIPLAFVLLLEIYFAFRLDWKSFRQRATLPQMVARLLYSLLVPWVAAWNQAVGEFTKTNQPNRQNA